MMPAFSKAISASVCPRWRSWSNAIDVMADVAGVMTLVASKRPPSPTSMTAAVTFSRAKISNAMAVVTSKKVGVAARAPLAVSRSIASKRSRGRAIEDARIDGRAVDGDAFLDAIEVRRRVAAGAIAARAQAALDHRRDRPLAVGARDMNGGPAPVRPIERRQNRLDVVEPELDAERLEREEPFTQAHWAAS